MIPGYFGDAGGPVQGLPINSMDFGLGAPARSEDFKMPDTFGKPGQVWSGREWIDPPKKVDTSNPKDVIGSTKLPVELWPATATILGSLALLDGLMKYGRTNWRATDVRASIYVAACKRHLDAWFEGEDIDPDSKVPHLAHALACLAILVDADASGTLIDDRQMQIKYRDFVNKYTPLVEQIKRNHAERVPPHHFTIKDSK